MDDNRLTLIVGSDSLIGRALGTRLRQSGHAVLGTSRRPGAADASTWFLDLAAVPDDWSPPAPVAVAVLCAGVTRMDACRTDPAATARANVHGVATVAERLAARGTFVIYLSSNAVFDGSAPRRRPTDPVSPVTEYGRQKAAAEKRVSACGPRASVVRFTKVLEPGAPLLTSWARALRAGESVRPFSDLVMAPVPLSFAADVLQRIVETRPAGIVQVSADRDVTYAEAAAHVARAVGADPNLVRPIRSEDAGVHLEAAPAHTTLDTTRLREELGLTPPDVRTAIESAVV